MYSIAFPNFLKSARTELYQDNKATLSNLKLLLASEKKSLFGDPYYGSNLKRFLFEQNNKILRHLIIDDIYTAILEFMPQLYVERNYIKVNSDGHKVTTTVKCINKVDHQINLYEINLTAEGEDMIGNG